MFTGIIEAVGVIAGVQDQAGSRRFVVEAPELVGGLKEGASVAVDGACQTVVGLSGERFTVETIGTTLARTIAGRYRVGSRVNLERAMVLGGRLDGHLVQGHVDGVGKVLSLRREGEYWLLDFEMPPVVDAVTVLHGSIAVNGVSLTVNALPGPGRCQVGLIPYTWAHTNLGLLKPGESVNLEGDLVGKHVAKLLSAWRGPSELSLESLTAWGFRRERS